MTLAVFSVDPGETTGWSYMEVSRVVIEEQGEINLFKSIKNWRHGQVGGPEIKQVKDLNMILSEYAYDIPRDNASVIVEDFILRMYSKDRAVLAPVRITAMLELCLDLVGNSISVKQQPSEAMGVITDDRLKNWGFYERAGGMGHARDADRHNLYALRKARSNVDYRKKLWSKLDW